MRNLLVDFLSQDKVEQESLQKSWKDSIEIKFKNNLAFFKQNYQDIYDAVANSSSQDYSVFVTKFNYINIYRKSTGTVVYNSNPSAECASEVSSFLKSPLSVNFSLKEPKEAVNGSDPSCNDKVILNFGIGSGYHLPKIISELAPKVLIIYEPEIDLFITSLSMLDWEYVFELANRKNIIVSLQIGNAGTNINAELAEILEHFPSITSLNIYRHLCHPVSDEVINYLIQNSGQLNLLTGRKPHFLGYTNDSLFVGERSKSNLLNIKYDEYENSEIFNRNLKSIKEFFPKIYDALVSYSPKEWFLVKDNELPNIFCEKRGFLLFDDVLIDSERVVSRFLKHPLFNETVLNQGGIYKYKNYVHFKAVRKLQDIFKRKSLFNLNSGDHVENLIMVGLGVGKHLEVIINELSLGRIFIFEPNFDFFFASLHVIDWGVILNESKAAGRHIYLNVGGQGKEYFNDIMDQFYVVGAHSLSDTYFLPAFLTPNMAGAYEKLSNSLKVIVSVGENFDHVRYGISHTLNSIVKGHRFLKRSREHSLKFDVLSKPVFIIGNGPSIDYSFQYIKEHRDDVIVISCGTVLKSLYKLGIRPDIHAEIEQNRATYCWISQVNDLEWLKSIRLLSVNGIHPETADLFKEVLIAFKEGETSTNFFNKELKNRGIELQTLRFSYPTVSNMVIDFCVELGFEAIYLFGIDLGYKDIESHHSKFSAYYRDNEEGIFDAKVKFNDGISVEGNFAKRVFTKHEFKFSKDIFEMRLRRLPKRVQVYNCSDGVAIQNATPLLGENILIKSQGFSSQEALDEISEKWFYSESLIESAGIFENTISQVDFGFIVDKLLLLNYPVKSKTQARNLIEDQWSSFLLSYKSVDYLAFYLLCSSLTYMLSVMTRVRSDIIDDDDFEGIERFNEVVSIWRCYLSEAKEEFNKNRFAFCDVDISKIF